MKTTLIYDGSFEGFLSSVFHVYEYKLDDVSIIKKENPLVSLFGTEEVIDSDSHRAKRVWNGLSKKISTFGKRKLYKAFLSEILGIEDSMLHYIRYALSSSENVERDFSNAHILEIEKTVKKVNREKHRMDAFVRFRLTTDGIYFATIAPDFNVLPLNATHFKKRYADQKWLIYDLKRKYGIYYDLKNVQTVQLEISETINTQKEAPNFFTLEEIQFQKLWGNYFKNSNIASRKNMRLHIKHIPKRYWKYLTEKNF